LKVSPEASGLKLIEQGEHQQQDFKYCISDSKKIARSLVAFANTDGGRLLIGVKDNGHIAGVRSEEEYYMVEAAARIYSKPIIPFTTRQHFIESKTVLEVKIERSAGKPHFAVDEKGKWWAYFRKDDENRLANKVMLEVWKNQKSVDGILINYSDAEKILLDYLPEYSGQICTHCPYTLQAGRTDYHQFHPEYSGSIF